MSIASCVTLPGMWLSDGGAARAQGAGKERRDVRDDGHQRAGQGAVIDGGHGDDYVVLVPHVEGVWVGVAQARRHVKRVDTLYL